MTTIAKNWYIESMNKSAPSVGLRAGPLIRQPADSGQALLIILLIMAVVLTISLSVVSRSVTDITVSKKEEDSARAFSAAEAGVEQVLKGSNVYSGSLPNSASFAVGNPTAIIATAKDFVFPSLVSFGESVTLWLVAHDSNGDLACSASLPCFTGNKLKFCWGESGTGSSNNTTPALEVSVLYRTSSSDYSTATVARGSYDPNSARSAGNHFAGASGVCTIAGKDFAFSKTVDLNSDLLISSDVTGTQNRLQMARVRLLYNTDKAHPVGVTADIAGASNTDFPSQGIKIVSTGQAGDASRKVEVTQTYADLPPVFDFGVFSGSGDLSK